MITKTAEDLLYKEAELKKEAALLSHLSIPAGAHVAQNLAARGLMGSKRYSKHLTESAAAGLVGKNVRKSRTPMSRGIIPEVGMVKDEVTNLSKGVRANLQEAGHTVDSLGNVPKRELVNIRRLLRGEYGKLYNSRRQLQNSPYFDSVIDSLSEQGSSIDKNTLMQLMEHPAGKEIAKDLEKVHGDYALTNKVMKGIGDNMTSVNPENIVGKSHSANNASDLAGIGMVTAADPLTGVVNTAKRLMTVEKFPGVTKHVKKPVHAGQTWMKNTFLKNPSRNKFNKGVAGEDIKFRKGKQFLDKNILNPVTSDVKNISYDMGKVFNKHGLTPKKMQNIQEGVDFIKKNKGRDVTSLKNKGLNKLKEVQN